jgi:hypothetical protein
MAKMLKNAAEIEALIMTAAATIDACDGLTGVTIQKIDDEKLPFNWTAKLMHNSSSVLCETAIVTIVDGMQRVIDLKD